MVVLKMVRLHKVQKMDQDWRVQQCLSKRKTPSDKHLYPIRYKWYPYFWECISHAFAQSGHYIRVARRKTMLEQEFLLRVCFKPHREQQKCGKSCIIYFSNLDKMLHLAEKHSTSHWAQHVENGGGFIMPWGWFLYQQRQESWSELMGRCMERYTGQYWKSC